jgi:predicted ATPase
VRLRPWRLDEEGFRDYTDELAAFTAPSRIELDPRVTFLVGENGSGKSTLVEAIGSQMAVALQQQQQQQAKAAAPPTAAPSQAGDHPTENPAHYLGMLEDLHDHGVLDDDEYTASRTRLLERLRA